MSITNTRGKSEVLKKHYQLLGKMSIDNVSDTNWKEEVIAACQRKLAMPF